MNKGDEGRLVELIDSLHGRRRHSRDEVAVWGEVLRPWDFDTVREAVIARAQKMKDYPDPSEIAALLPAPPEKQVAVKGREANAGQASWARRYHDRLRAELELRGLEPFSGNTGAEYQEWRATIEAAGIDPARIAMEARA